MDAQTALLLGAAVGFVAGWSISRAGLRDYIANARKAIGKLRSSVADTTDARFMAGFAAGVAAYPELNDKGRKDVLDAWLSK